MPLKPADYFGFLVMSVSSGLGVRDAWESVASFKE